MTIANMQQLFVPMGKDRLFFVLSWTYLLFFFSSLYIRSCPTLASVHCLAINCRPTLLQYHPRYLLSSVEASLKQHWLAVNHQTRILLIDTLQSDSPILNDLMGHSGDVECLAWSPSIDSLLASGAQDKTIRVKLCRYWFHSDLFFSLVMECRDGFTTANLRGTCRCHSLANLLIDWSQLDSFRFSRSIVTYLEYRAAYTSSRSTDTDQYARRGRRNK